MKKMMLGLAIAAGFLPVLPAAAADVGLSIGINQPGVYGRIDIGRVAVPPVLVYQQPVVIVQNPVAVQRQPIYMHVPPGHAKDWRRYCDRYQACGQPVYFVQDRWYRDAYEPAYRAKPDKRHHKDDRGHRSGRDDDDRAEGRKEGRGHGNGHGNGKHGKD
jgi:hypothetical protein